LTRKINNKPFKVIESPGLMDDFYLNLIDWSSQNDLAVGESNSVHIWCANKTQKVKLISYEGDKYVSSLIWNQGGTELAVGNSEGSVEIWDGKGYIF
jgi:WD40 repeat protein